MSPLYCLALCIVVSASPAVAGQDQELYENEEWLVSYDEEYLAFTPACISETNQSEGLFTLYLMPDVLEAHLVRKNSFPGMIMENTKVGIRVDDHDPILVAAEFNGAVVSMTNVPTLLMGQMAAGKLLQVDVNFDGRYDDDYSLANAYPAMKTLADCTARF